MSKKTIPAQLGPLLGETARAWRNKLDERLRPLGLSQAKWLVLLHLSKEGDGIVQKELASRLGVEGPTLVGLLDRMAVDEWIERRESASDRRCKTVHLTEKAQAVTRQIMKVAAELRRELLADIRSEEIETCMRVIRRIKETAERL
jgi:MarR family transcriptional regulator for hemolysin